MLAKPRLLLSCQLLKLNYLKLEDLTMNSLLLAISFLTIIPVYGNRTAGEKDMADSLYFYPPTGFLIGLILAGAAYLFELLSLARAGDAIIILVWIIITGALHLDGLMDSADGLFSGREREKKLEIMRDSRVGAMGVIAFGSIMLLKFTFLNSLTYADKLGVLLISPAFGRWAMVYAVSFFPYARSGPGLGKSFGNIQGPGRIIAASITLLAVAFLFMRWEGICIIALTSAIVVLMARWMAGCLGGMTGDTYGALCEVAETLFMMITVIAMTLFVGI